MKKDGYVKTSESLARMIEKIQAEIAEIRARDIQSEKAYIYNKYEPLLDLLQQCALLLKPTAHLHESQFPPLLIHIQKMMETTTVGTGVLERVERAVALLHGCSIDIE